MDNPPTANLVDLWATDVKQPIGAVRKYCDGKSPPQLAALVVESYRGYVEAKKSLRAACGTFDEIKTQAMDGVDTTTLDQRLKTAIDVYAQADGDHASIWAQLAALLVYVISECPKCGIPPVCIGLLDRVLNSPPDTFSPPLDTEFVQAPVKVETHWLACQVALSALENAEFGQSSGEGGPDQKLSSVGKPPKKAVEPPKEAMKAYRMVLVTGRPQSEVAETLNTNQGQISRWVKLTTTWIKAGNVLPDIEGLHAKPVSVDPKVIDMGLRQDRRTKRQRQRTSDDGED